MLSDDEIRAFMDASGHAFEALSKNQRALAQGIEGISDALACLALSIMAHGYITEDTYETVQKRVEERRKELRDEPDCDILAKVFQATKPSEN